MKTLCILGATGSIGQSTLDVVRRHPDKFSVHSVSANANVEGMLGIIKEFSPKVVVMASEVAAEALSEKVNSLTLTTIVKAGANSLIDIAKSDDNDTVMAAIVGASGLLPTLAAVEQGKRVLLANKEALVTSGQIFIDAVKHSGAQLLPIDSEHNAIFQCLPEKEQNQPGFCTLVESGISKILLTGSGGPFRTRELDSFEDITPEQACTHPNWDMGKKISVDSATMMNKGLEFIEAKWLFNVKPEQIQVVLHPQSTIHSMVQYVDGSVIAQMGNPDMRTPIAHAMAYPERVDAGVEPLDFFSCASFDFQQPDASRYPNLMLAIKACKLGQAACTALNAANEIAVEAFLNKTIKFTDIFKINETSVNKFVSEKTGSIEEVVALDCKVREFAVSLLSDFEGRS